MELDKEHWVCLLAQIRVRGRAPSISSQHLREAADYLAHLVQIHLESAFHLHRWVPLLKRVWVQRAELARARLVLLEVCLEAAWE